MANLPDENGSSLKESIMTATDESVKPSFKPLIWLGGGLLVFLGLWEVLLEFGLNFFELLFDIIEHIWLWLVEAPEEFLEDRIADWLKTNFPHDADRYSEIITAFVLTPLKIVLVLFLLKSLWQHSRARFFPAVVRWFKARYAEVFLAWQGLAWYYKIIFGIFVLGVLAIII
jgi:hypothetical protein